MPIPPQDKLSLEPVSAKEPLIGHQLACLIEGRRRTKHAVNNLSPTALDWQDKEFPNSIGTLLYHIAAIEMDWLFTEILEEAFPANIINLFPHDVRDDEGMLTPVKGLGLADHLERLDITRAIFLEQLEAMTLQDFLRLRQLPDYDVSPAWVLMHLAHHEASHQGQILLLRQAAERAHL